MFVQVQPALGPTVDGKLFGGLLKTKFLSENFIKFQMLGQFWNPYKISYPKLTLEQ